MELIYLIRTSTKLVAAFDDKEEASKAATELSAMTGNSHGMESVPLFHKMDEMFANDAAYWKKKYEKLKQTVGKEEDRSSSYGSSGGGGHD